MVVIADGRAACAVRRPRSARRRSCRRSRHGRGSNAARAQPLGQRRRGIGLEQHRDAAHAPSVVRVEPFSSAAANGCARPGDRRRRRNRSGTSSSSRLIALGPVVATPRASRPAAPSPPGPASASPRSPCPVTKQTSGPRRDVACNDRGDERLLVGVLDLAELLARDDDDGAQLDDAVALASVRSRSTSTNSTRMRRVSRSNPRSSCSTRGVRRRGRTAAASPACRAAAGCAAFRSLTSLRPDAVRSTLHGLYQTAMLSITSAGDEHRHGDAGRDREDAARIADPFDHLAPVPDDRDERRSPLRPRRAARPVRSHSHGDRGADERRDQQQRAGNRQIAPHVSFA